MAGWYLLYSATDNLRSLRAARNADGRLEIFGINAAGNIYHTWQTSPSNGWNGTWDLLYSASDNLAMLDASNNADGRLEIFGINAAGNIYHTWQTSPSNGWNGTWDLLYSASDNLRSLRAARNADGRLEIFGINAAGNIYHTWQTSPSNGWNGTWELLYSASDNLAMLDVSNDADGRLEIFGINAAGNIYHTWQTSPSNGWNGTWDLLYSATDNLAMLDVTNDADGRLEVFGINAAGNIYHTWQTAPSNGWVGDQLSLPFTVEPQTESEWCWAAVSTSINHFYDSASTVTQCQVVNQQLGRTDCCNNPASSNCNVPGYLDQALQYLNNFTSEKGQGTDQDIVQAINAGEPPCIRIGWSGGGGHFIGVFGYEPDDYIWVTDPIYNNSLVSYEALTTGQYEGSGTWTNTYFTQS